MNYSAILTENLILNLSILSWLIAQVLKVVVSFLWKGKLDFRLVMSGGGMPSSHSAFACTCATAVGRMYGWSSPMFAIGTVLAIVVMYDASNVRRAAGEQAKILNYMMDNWTEMPPDMFQKKLKELLGHTPLQVFAGAVLGITVGFFGPALMKAL